MYINFWYPMTTSEELEAWTYDLNPTYSGIGSYVQMDEGDGRLILTQPMFGGPAYKAGLEPGDKVIKIDGWQAVGRLVFGRFVRGRHALPAVPTEVERARQFGRHLGREDGEHAGARHQVDLR